MGYPNSMQSQGVGFSIGFSPQYYHQVIQDRTPWG